MKDAMKEAFSVLNRRADQIYVDLDVDVDLVVDVVVEDVDVDVLEVEELLFAALHHDLGKLGTKEEMHYIPNDSDWHIKNQGAYYKINNNDHYIYSLDEIYQIAQTNMIDPITRTKIFNHEIIRVRIK